MSFSCTWGFCLLRFCLFLWKYLVVEKLCFCLTNWILKLFYQKISFQIISWVLICSEVDGSCSLYFHCSIVVVSLHCLGKRRLSCSKLKLRGKKMRGLILFPFYSTEVPPINLLYSCLLTSFAGKDLLTFLINWRQDS